MKSLSEIENKVKSINPRIKTNKKMLDTIANAITDEEKILYVVSGVAQCQSNVPGIGVTVKHSETLITTKRILVVLKNMTSYNTMNILIESIKGTNVNKVAFGNVIITIDYNAMRATLTVGSKEEADCFMKTLNNQINNMEQLDKNKDNTDDDDILGKIEKLSELCKQGIITEEEFTLKKKELLEKL